MPTIKPRINVTLTPKVKNAIAKLAAREDIPDATLAARLIETALELEEDLTWGEMASERDKKSAKFISHDKAWE